MKKLYILLLSLIVIYLCVNIVYTIYFPDKGFTRLLNNPEEEILDNSTIIVGDNSFTKLDNIANTTIDSNAVSLVDFGQNLTMNVNQPG